VARLPLILALLILPSAVAGHNIGTGVYGLILFAQMYLKRRRLPVQELWADMKVPLIASAAFIFWGLISSALNPAMPLRTSGSFAFGYLIWALLPVVVFLAQEPLDAKGLRAIKIAAAVVAAVMGTIAVSQASIGWKLQGSNFI